MTTSDHSTTAAALELETTPAEVKRYNRLKLLSGLAVILSTLAFLIVMSFWGGQALDAQVRRITGDNRWLRLAALGFVYAAGMEILGLPFSFWSGYILEHRYQLSNQSLGGWAWHEIKGYLLGGPIGLVLLLGFYSLLWYSGSWWWLWATGGWLAATLVLGLLLPVLILPLFYKSTPLEDPELLERLRRLSAGTGLAVEGIYRLHLSDETKKANAALAGLGRTRRVLLGDTLLDAFTAEEIEVVFAHEVGHHVYRHLRKFVVWSIAAATATFWLIDVVVRHAAQVLDYSAFDDPAALPLMLLMPFLFGMFLTPARNALSRHFERQCDRYALERTAQPAAYRSAFVKLARMNKVDADPHSLAVWLFHDHPPIRERIGIVTQG